MNPTQQDKNPEQYRALVSVSRALAVVCFLLVVFVVIVIILNNTSVDKLSRLGWDRVLRLSSGSDAIPMPVDH